MRTRTWLSGGIIALATMASVASGAAAGTPTIEQVAAIVRRDFSQTWRFPGVVLSLKDPATKLDITPIAVAGLAEQMQAGLYRVGVIIPDGTSNYWDTLLVRGDAALRMSRFGYTETGVARSGAFYFAASEGSGSITEVFGKVTVANGAFVVQSTSFNGAYQDIFGVRLFADENGPISVHSTIGISPSLIGRIVETSSGELQLTDVDGTVVAPLKAPVQDFGFSKQMDPWLGRFRFAVGHFGQIGLTFAYRDKSSGAWMPVNGLAGLNRMLAQVSTPESATELLNHRQFDELVARILLGERETVRFQKTLTFQGSDWTCTLTGGPRNGSISSWTLRGSVAPLRIASLTAALN